MKDTLSLSVAREGRVSIERLEEGGKGAAVR